MSTPGFGAIYPAAALADPVTRERRMVRYRFTTPDPLAKVAAFYRAEGAGGGVPVLDAVIDWTKRRTVGRIAFPVSAC